MQLEGTCNLLSALASTRWKLQLPWVLLATTRRRLQPLVYNSNYWMEAPTSLFLGTNLKMATTTCLSRPCHLVMKINSSSTSICNIFIHFHLFTSHFCSFIVTALLLFSLSHSSPWSSSTSTLSPNQQCTSLAHVHTPMLLTCCALSYFHVYNQKRLIIISQAPRTSFQHGDRGPVQSDSWVTYG